MSTNKHHKWKARNLYRGLGIRVAIKGDIDENGQQKHRPGIIIKSYPSHVMVQLLSRELSEHDYFSTFINHQKQYIRPIYFRTIKFDEILKVWKDDSGQIIKLKKGSTFFTKIAEMQFNEINWVQENQNLEKTENILKAKIASKEYELE
ncbi:MAG: hypothetical protein REH79_02540 [Spiroplasma sp.]|nr:hypothetical protein [Spiroplasma sp.]